MRMPGDDDRAAPDAALHVQGQLHRNRPNVDLWKPMRPARRLFVVIGQAIVATRPGWES
jgi:hypothetical protein